MRLFYRKMAGAAAVLFTLAACSESNSDYPEKYVGFAKTTVRHSFDRNKDTEDLNIKIIAAEKKDRDREVLVNGISMPGQTVVFNIENKKVIIPANKKSANLHVKIYPKKIKKRAEFRIVCIPQDKEAKRTQLTVRLEPK